MALVCSDLMYRPFVSAYQSHEPMHCSLQQSSCAGGLGACYAAQRGARGAAPTRMRVAPYQHHYGENLAATYHPNPRRKQQLCAVPGMNKKSAEELKGLL